MLPGTFVRVRVAQALAADVVTVPQKAVLSGPQGQYVMLVGPGDKAMPQPVKLGAMAGRSFVVEDGLKGGERLIVTGLQKARPGTVVKPVLSKQAD